jgi:hypothetical protein
MLEDHKESMNTRAAGPATVHSSDLTCSHSTFECVGLSFSCFSTSSDWWLRCSHAVHEAPPVMKPL